MRESRPRLLARTMPSGPIFRRRLRWGRGRHYAIGATKGRPGYFLASRSMGRTGRSGLLSSRSISRPWRRSGAVPPSRLGFAMNSVYFSSRAPDVALSAVAAALGCCAQSPHGKPAIWLTPTDRRAACDGHAQGRCPAADHAGKRAGGSANRRSLASHGWSLVQLQSVEEISKRALLVAAFVAVALGATGLMLLVLNERRAHSRSRQRAYAELERRVEERTLELRRAQDSLVQSAKLAGLGQA